jgi:hypothetical protein
MTATTSGTPRLGQDEERYSLEEGEPLDVLVRGQRHVLCREKELVLPAAQPPASPS